MSYIKDYKDYTPNIKQVHLDHSYVMFTECEYFRDKPKHDDEVLATGEALLCIKEKKE